MSAFKDRLLEVLSEIRDELRELRGGQARLEVVAGEASLEVERLRTAVMDQAARQQEQLSRHQRRLTEHDVRLRNIEEGLPNGAE